MRIDRLDLLRFGKFTDFSLDFGDYSAGQPDLHIVYGPNEAGKSTLMAAYLDFLFGFPQKTPYNFKHVNSVLKIGAVISIGDETREYRRLKRTKSSLIDANEQPVNDSTIQQQLAGLGKESYATMFSLDDETLEKGGENILASKGELGKLLYSATTGVAQLSESLLEIRVDTARFYEKGKRKFELAELKARLKGIESERKRLDTEASGYSKLVKERKETDDLYQNLGAEHGKLKLQIHKLQLKKNAFPRLNSMSRLQAELSPLSILPDVPAGWFDEAPKLKVGSVEINTREQGLVEKLTSLDELMSRFILDESALGANRHWQQIESDRTNYLLACSNLPELQQQTHLCEHELGNCLQKLDRVAIEQPASLLLNVSTQANLRELIQQQPALVSRLEAAKRELMAATNQHNESRERFVVEGGSLDSESGSSDGAVVSKRRNAATDELELEVAALANNELGTRQRTAEHQLAALQDELNASIAKLSPWNGGGQALQSLTMPHSSILQTLRQRRDAIESRINEAQVSLQASTQTIEHTRSKQQAYSVTGLVDDAESARLRREREEAWVKHRQALDAITADDFEKTLHADDVSQATRLQHTETLAQMNQMTRDILIAEACVKQTNAHLAQCHAEQKAVATELGELINNISPALNTNMLNEAVIGWIEARADALQVVQKMNLAERELTSIKDQAVTACSSLSRSIKSVGITIDDMSDQASGVMLVSLLKMANSAIKREAVLSGLRDQLVTSQRQLTIRTKAIDSAEQSLEQWDASWETACKSCWLGGQSENISTNVVEEVLQQLLQLEQQLRSQSGLQDKMTHHNGVVDAFGQSLSALAEMLSITSENLSIDQLHQTLYTRMEKATEGQKSLDNLQSQKDEVLELQKINHEKRVINRQSIASMTTHFSVDSIDEVELKLQAVNKKESLQERIADEEQEILGMLAVTLMSIATDMLAGFDDDAAQLELENLERIASDVQLQLQEAHTARELARKAVESVGGDDAVAMLAEQRANLMLEIEDRSTRYLQQHLALIAADAALKTYRDNHRSSMMKNASDAFAKITQGRYTHLDTQQEGSTEILIAIDKDGQSKLSSQLSKGTRFQLYLALRVAGYHEYASTRPSVPFIADDIMETADDKRAESTFEVLGEMARVGQVIYLTHHQHLCNIAQKVVPACRIHQLV